MRPWVITRSGQNRTSQDVGRAVTNAACSLCSTAHVFGMASVNTKSTTTLSTKPRTAPHVPSRRVNKNVLSEAVAVCRMLTVSRIGLRNFSGCSTRRSSARPRTGCSWASDSALCRVIRLMPVSATPSRASSTNSTSRKAKISASLVVNSAPSIRGEPSPPSCSWRNPSGTGPRQWCRCRCSSSRARITLASCDSAWSWPTTWRMPCTTSRASSSSSVPACEGACSAATLGHTTTSPSSTGTPGVVSSSSGNDSTSVGASLPMCSRLRAAISSRSTNVSVSSPSRSSSVRTARASSLHRSTSMAISSCSSAATTVGLGGSLIDGDRRRARTRRRCRRRCGGARRRTP